MSRCIDRPIVLDRTVMPILLGRWHYELLHRMYGLVYQPRGLSDIVFSAKSQPHTPMTRVNPSGIDDDIRALCGHRAIAQEKSSFSLPFLYRGAGSRQGRKYFHRISEGGELNKATETPWNEYSDTTCRIGQSASKSSHKALENREPTHFYASMHQYVLSS